MKITFRKFNDKDISLFLRWAEAPQVKNSWFKPGYPQPQEYLDKNILVKSDAHPYIILLDGEPIGYIQYWDIDEYLKNNPGYKIFANEPLGTYGLDLFIGEEKWLDKGLGSKILVSFMDEIGARRYVIDPSIKNKRAVRCYQKAGFKIIREDNDGVEQIYIMEKLY